MGASESLEVTCSDEKQQEDAFHSSFTTRAQKFLEQTYQNQISDCDNNITYTPAKHHQRFLNHRFDYIRFPHNYTASKIIISKDGTKNPIIATLSTDNTINIWQLKTKITTIDVEHTEATPKSSSHNCISNDHNTHVADKQLGARKLKRKLVSYEVVHVCKIDDTIRDFKKKDKKLISNTNAIKRIQSMDIDNLGAYLAVASKNEIFFYQIRDVNSNTESAVASSTALKRPILLVWHSFYLFACINYVKFLPYPHSNDPTKMYDMKSILFGPQILICFKNLLCIICDIRTRLNHSNETNRELVILRRIDFNDILPRAHKIHSIDWYYDSKNKLYKILIASDNRLKILKSTTLYFQKNKYKTDLQWVFGPQTIRKYQLNVSNLMRIECIEKIKSKMQSVNRIKAIQSRMINNNSSRTHNYNYNYNYSYNTNINKVKLDNSNLIAYHNKDDIFLFDKESCLVNKSSEVFVENVNSIIIKDTKTRKTKDHYIYTDSGYFGDCGMYVWIHPRHNFKVKSKSICKLWPLLSSTLQNMEISMTSKDNYNNTYNIDRNKKHLNWDWNSKWNTRLKKDNSKQKQIEQTKQQFANIEKSLDLNKDITSLCIFAGMNSDKLIVSKRVNTIGLCITLLDKWLNGVSVVIQIILEMLQFENMGYCNGILTTRREKCHIIDISTSDNIIVVAKENSKPECWICHPIQKNCDTFEAVL